MAKDVVSVQGFRDLNRALARADKDVRADARKIMKGVAEPVAQAAEMMAATSIRNIGTSWPLMRIGVTTKSIYVVPRQRRRTGGARPNLGRLLAQRAMKPAEARYAPTYRAELERAMDKLADRFNHS